jgi:PadR family transcriptional regulator PadR
MRKEQLIDELLSAWEETYKKGQLTFWVLLSLKESNKCVEEIKDFVEKMSNGSMTCEEQSLYRNLRKFQHLGIVEYDSKRVSKGPDRKYYFLSDIGKELFQRFVERNILIFTNETINNIIKN